MKKVYAVIDTNVLVASMLTKNQDSATLQLINALYEHAFTTLYNNDILKEYYEVLSREKFGFAPNVVKGLIDIVRDNGVHADRIPSGESFPDPTDAVFYEVALSKVGAFVVTGNARHSPNKPIVVTPAELLEILYNN